MELTQWQRTQMNEAELDEFEHWRAKIQADDKREARQQRRWRDHLDDMDITLIDRNCNEEYLDRSKCLRISTDEDFLDIIYSRRAEDLHELATDEKVVAALKKLTSRQKQVLFHLLPPHTKTAHVAHALDTTSRNILKILTTARKNIRKTIGEPA